MGIGCIRVEEGSDLKINCLSQFIRIVERIKEGSTLDGWMISH